MGGDNNGRRGGSALLCDRRSRRVVFRLSEEDYKRIQEMSTATGAGTVSELVRTAIHQWVESGAGRVDNQLEPWIEAVEERLSYISSQVERLSSTPSAIHRHDP